ncbi:HAD hydrolase-like protein [Secundilactobacillus muriivasis]
MTKQLFFDFDGTVADSEQGTVRAVKYCVEQMKLKPLTEDDYRSFIGPTIYDSLAHFYPELTQADINQGADLFHDYYREVSLFDLTIYPQFLETMTTLKQMGYQLNLASAKIQAQLDRLVAHFALDQYFTGVYGAIPGAMKKPAILATGIASTGVDPKKALMVGDREMDVEGGHANHVPVIGVTYGFGSREELSAHRAEVIVDRPTEIVEAVQKLIG